MLVHDLEDVALAARRRLGLGDDSPLPDIVRTLESEGGLRVFALSLGQDGIAGAYSVVREQPFLLVNASNPPVRQRFTLGHEYGHHFLGHGARTDETIDFSSPDSRERDANAFAAAFLMPQPAIDRWLAAHDGREADLEVVVRLAAFFGTSAAAMRFRLENVGRLKGAGKIRSLDSAIRSGEHSRLAGSLGVAPLQDSVLTGWRRGMRVPLDMESALQAAVEKGLMEPDAAGAWIGVDPTELQTLERERSLDDDAVEVTD